MRIYMVGQYWLTWIDKPRQRMHTAKSSALAIASWRQSSIVLLIHLKNTSHEAKFVNETMGSQPICVLSWKFENFNDENFIVLFPFLNFWPTTVIIAWHTAITGVGENSRLLEISRPLLAKLAQASLEQSTSMESKQQRGDVVILKASSMLEREEGEAVW